MFNLLNKDNLGVVSEADVDKESRKGLYYLQLIVDAVKDNQVHLSYAWIYILNNSIINDVSLLPANVDVKTYDGFIMSENKMAKSVRNKDIARLDETSWKESTLVDASQLSYMSKQDFLDLCNKIASDILYN